MNCSFNFCRTMYCLPRLHGQKLAASPNVKYLKRLNWKLKVKRDCTAMGASSYQGRLEDSQCVARLQHSILYRWIKKGLWSQSGNGLGWEQRSRVIRSSRICQCIASAKGSDMIRIPFWPTDKSLLRLCIQTPDSLSSGLLIKEA